MIPPPFVHLHACSAFSLGFGAIKVKKLVSLAQEAGMPAMALADRDNMFGILEWATACAEAGIQPVPGLDVHVQMPVPPQPAASWDEGRTPLVFLARNETGYRNLMALATAPWTELTLNGKAGISLGTVARHAEGLIVLTGGADSALNRWVASGQTDKAEEWLGFLQKTFPGAVYVELMRAGWPGEARTEAVLLDLAWRMKIPVVATGLPCFEAPDLYEAHDALLCIAAGTYVSEPHRARVTPDCFFRSQTEMRTLFADLPEALDNTAVVAMRCTYIPRGRSPLLPAFPCDAGRSEQDELAFQAAEGLKYRLETVPADRHPDYMSRLDYEVAMINRMGFAGYFLIVSDFIRWAKDRGIPVGPGRGSGAGSLVAWALSITDLDPIRFNLLFERFLNPERVSMPDFDIDFCQDRRDEVIIYVREKYGADRVAHIITFGKLQARAVLRDVGRVLHIPYPVVDKVCKLVPNNPNQPVTLPEAIAADSQLQAMIGQDEAMQKLVEMATRLEGLYRHASTHAAGVVIADRPLTELVPLYQDPRSALPATQFSMKDVERAGLLKFDFLGLKTLTVLALAARMVKENRGTDIDLSRIPLDDPATFALLQRVETTGVFQLESKGMRDVVARLQPDRFEEIVALVALYRPGPMDDIPRYLACKQGLEPVQYMHPALEPILEETFGVMVYQEQVMQIAQVLAGYSLGQADLLRRAMGKKIRSEMEAQEKQFVRGAVERGVEHDVATRIFQQMSKFAGYGFNKSHSAPYALVAYQTAWMKANFLPEFMGALMTLDMHNTDKLGGYVQELAHLGLPLLPPDINHSRAAFAVEVQPDGQKALRYGLAAIRNVGRSLAEALVEARKQGPYRSLPDMMGRLDSSLVNRRQIEHLVFAGALDSVHPCRRALHEGLEGWMKEAARAREQAGLFDAGPVQEPAVADKADWPTLERLEYERQAIGFYLSSHPFERYKVFLGRCGVQTVLDMTAGSEESGESGAGEPDQDYSVWSFRLAGILTQVQKRRTKKGQVFAFVQLSDPAGMVDIAVFPELYQTCLGSLVVGQHVVIEGQGRAEAEQSRLVASQITLFDSFLSEQLRVLDLQVGDPRVLPGLADLLGSAPRGPGRIRLVPVDEAARPVILSGYRLVFQMPSRILFSARLLDQIDSLPGCHVPWHVLGI